MLSLHLTMKQKIINTILRDLHQKIATAESAIASAIESRDNETKSSVGDKYETGRAMMQLEQQKNEAQLVKLQMLKSTMERIAVDQILDRGAQGALMKTSNGIFFLSIGLGKLKVDEEIIFVISMASPIGKELIGKRVGDRLVFNGKEMEILELS